MQSRLSRLSTALFKREKKLEIINKLKANKGKPVRILDNLSIHMPDKMCLRSLKKQGAQLELTGWALTDEVIANFMTALQGSKRFIGVELIVTERFKPQGTDINIKKFTITGVIGQ